MIVELANNHGPRCLASCSVFHLWISVKAFYSDIAILASVSQMGQGQEYYYRLTFGSNTFTIYYKYLHSIKQSIFAKVQNQLQKYPYCIVFSRECSYHIDRIRGQKGREIFCKHTAFLHRDAELFCACYILYPLSSILALPLPPERGYTLANREAPELGLPFG